MQIGYVVAELVRRPARSLAGVLSVAVGVALFLSLQAYAAGYRAAARAPLAGVGAELVVQRDGDLPEQFTGVVLPHSAAPILADEIAALSSLPGVQATGSGLFFWSFDADRFLAGLGVDPTSMVATAPLLAGVREGRFFQPGERGVAVAADQQLALGDVVTVAGRSFTVVGLVDTSRAAQVARADIYLPLEDARHLVPTVGPADANLLFLRTDPLRSAAVATAAARLLGDRSRVTTSRTFEASLGGTFILVDRFGMLVGLAGLLVAAAGLVRTAAAGLSERRRDIGLMRAVGWRRGEIVLQAVAETLTVTLLGSLSGVLLAAVAVALLRSTHVTVPIPWELSPTPHFLPGGAREVSMTVPFGAQITAEMAVGAVGLALCCGAAVSFWLARRAAAIKPAEVWQRE